MRWLKKWTVMGTVAAVVGSGALLAHAAVLQQEKQEKQKQKQKIEKPQERHVQIVDGVRGLISGGGARIGVSLRDVDEAAARERKLPAQEGAVVENVEEGSPAEKAGIRDGDVIAGFDGERVRSVRQLQRMVQETPPGRTVKLSVLRDGKRTDLDVTPEEREGLNSFAWVGPRIDAEVRRGVEEGLHDLPREFHFEGPNVYSFGRRLPEGGPLPEGFRFEGPFLHMFGGEGRLGASVQGLTPQLGEYFGSKEGVLVMSVNPDSPASRAGLKAGDVIVSVDGSNVSGPQDLVRSLREVDEGGEVKLGIVRDRKNQTLTVKLEDRSRVRTRTGWQA
jgi:serine protease Do